MIYISSASIRRASIVEVVKELAKNGFDCIELTAGNSLTEHWLQELLDLKAKFNLKYLCHNYFPPPKEPFVLNLASLNSENSFRSLELVKKALEFSELLGGTKYAVHAGFKIDVPVNQIGKRIDKMTLYNESKCWQRFINSVNQLYKYQSSVEMYIENNVFSAANFNSYGGVNPFYVTDLKSWSDLKNDVPKAKLLLDVAHLKVSCKTLNLNFEKELSEMIVNTNYIHLSDNDGLTDSNEPIKSTTRWLHILDNLSLSKDNVYTLEVYGDVSDIRRSYDLVKSTIC